MVVITKHTEGILVVLWCDNEQNTQREYWWCYGGDNERNTQGMLVVLWCDNEQNTGNIGGVMVW